MSIATWVLVHTAFLLTSDLLAGDSLKKDFRGITWYAVLCVCVFSFWESLQTAVAMSCVIASFYVICVVIHRIVMLRSEKGHFWMVSLICNNILIAAILLIFYGW